MWWFKKAKISRWLYNNSRPKKIPTVGGEPSTDGRTTPEEENDPSHTMMCRVSYDTLLKHGTERPRSTAMPPQVMIHYSYLPHLIHIVSSLCSLPGRFCNHMDFVRTTVLYEDVPPWLYPGMERPVQVVVVVITMPYDSLSREYYLFQELWLHEAPCPRWYEPTSPIPSLLGIRFAKSPFHVMITLVAEDVWRLAPPAYNNNPHSSSEEANHITRHPHQKWRTFMDFLLRRASSSSSNMSP